MARRAFAFGDRTAASLMTPCTEIEAVPGTATLDELFRVAAITRRNRLPVYEGSLDHVIGILHVRELFKHRMSPPQTFDLRSVIRAPLLTPETKTPPNCWRTCGPIAATQPWSSMNTAERPDW